MRSVLTIVLLSAVAWGASLPKKLKVCSEDYSRCDTFTITKKLRDRNFDGLTDCYERTIELDYKVHGRELAQLIVHEGMHAEFCADQMNTAAQQEKEVRSVHDMIYDTEGPISRLIHDNPKLAKFLLSAY